MTPFMGAFLPVPTMVCGVPLCGAGWHPAAGWQPALRGHGGCHLNGAAEGRPGWWVRALFGVWAAAMALARGPPLKAMLAVPAVIAPLLWWTLQGPARWLALVFGAAMLLPPLPIPLGDSGPHPSMLFAAIGLFAGLLWLTEWHVSPTGFNDAVVT